MITKKISLLNKLVKSLQNPILFGNIVKKIKAEYKDKNISIFIACKNSINRKPYQTLIDPNYDMAKAEWNHFRHNEWVLIDN